MSMSVLNLAIQTARPDTYLISNFETAGGNRAIANRLINYITGVFTGSEGAYASGYPPSIAISVQGNSVQASATLTCVSAVATDTVVVNGVTFTCVNSGATGNQFNVGASDTECAANIAAAINASVTALVSGYVSATSALGVVTVSAIVYGLSGNLYTLTTTGGHIAASSAKLVGGAADATAQTLQF
jgi:hypothetical protein